MYTYIDYPQTLKPLAKTKNYNEIDATIEKEFAGAI